MSLILHWSKEPRLKFSTNNARSEEVAAKPSSQDAWCGGQRCIIPVTSFDEPNWETGKNIWWGFRRADAPPGAWLYPLSTQTGQIVESYTSPEIEIRSMP
ncbi:SOS response-associated peptidase family protein [Dechloromonas denitrificans]|uniref:SOS response-associated peptidase family protein n=1 Tax=Dechloromonas denitrificans TaxID=281362 RepID=UPI001CF7F358|nr:SOS response-associated peptidase family protein [Dechloromonas denitrificans]